MKRFFSCDWGSTKFRLRLIDTTNLNTLAEIESNDGISEMFAQWNSSKEVERQQFYWNYLLGQLGKIKQQAENGSAQIPILVSGMASSNIGLLELPYKPLPVKTDGSDLIVQSLMNIGNGHNPIFLISGIRSECDVVRGEETMMVGCDSGKEDDLLLIFPGTHSKHISTANGTVKSIRSFLTGEMFQLLSTKSILRNSIKKPVGYEFPTNAYFTDGVAKGSSLNFLNSIFQVRINDLFKTANAEDNYAFLTGILIGHELKDLATSEINKLILVCSAELNGAYLHALKALYPSMQIIVEDAGATLIKGQWKLLQLLRSRKQL